MKLEALMDQQYNQFTSNERHIASCILQHKEDCAHLSIEAFARKYHVSTSALSRFAQKINLSGYRDIRSILRFEHSDEHLVTIDADVMLSSYKSVIDMIEQRDCDHLFAIMKKAKRIFIFGEGYSQSRVTKEMKRIFLPTGKKLYDVCGCDMIPSLLQVIEENDIIFLFSLHGERDELCQFARQLQIKKIPTISITAMKSNHLSHICDENLYIPSTSLPTYQDITYEVRTPYFILIELLYVKYRLSCSV